MLAIGKNSKRSIFFTLILTLAIILIANEHANDADAGDTITVPISWCAIKGSRAAADDPNIPNPYGGVDHTTDEVLWRRHERATDHIYNNNPLNDGNQAGISFRSAINDALHTTLDFPKLDDPNPAGTLGDLNREGDNGREYRDMLLACKDWWANNSRKHPGVISGIFAMNVRLTVNDLGQIIHTTGTGRCARDAMNECVPYDGHLYVIDNSFMLYGMTSGLPYSWMNKDEFDQSVSHELGHTLNLYLHRNTDPIALMNTNQQHNGPDGRVSNFKIYPQEVTEMRQTAIDYVPGVYMDPENKIIQGNTVQSIKVDKVKENKTLKPFEDIAVSIVTVDKKQKTVTFGQELYGIFPGNTKQVNQSNAEYWTLVDLDNNKNTGGNKTMLMNIKVPFTNFSGVDLAIVAKVSNNNETEGNNVTGNAWIFKDNNVTRLTSEDVRFNLQTAKIHGDHATNTKQVSENEIPLYNTINARLNNTNLIKLDSPFSIQSLVSSNGNVVDKLDYQQNESKTLELSQPVFPICHANQNGTKGDNVSVNSSGLLPNSNVHALLGTRLVANGTTDASGNSTVEFIVPEGTPAGSHLMTIGVDKTALTADCQIKVQEQNNAQD